MSDEASAPKVKKQQGRSPSYPAIDLQAAIARAQQLYDNERRSAAPVSVIQEGWGLTAWSGNANVQFAALTKFGLATSEGNGQMRTGRLTDLALDILLNPDEDQRQEAIRTAALTPKVIGELWKKYGGILPSDGNLRFELIRNRNFTDNGADEFMGVLRRTVAFADLRMSDTVGDAAPDQEAAELYERGDDAMTTTAAPVVRSAAPVAQPVGAQPVADGSLTIPILLGQGAQIAVTGRFPLTDAAWEQFMTVLRAMKAGLVQAPEMDQATATVHHHRDVSD